MSLKKISRVCHFIFSFGVAAGIAAAAKKTAKMRRSQECGTRTWP
jgi:hypothetical protein